VDSGGKLLRTNPRAHESHLLLGRVTLWRSKFRPAVERLIVVELVSIMVCKSFKV